MFGEIHSLSNTQFQNAGFGHEWSSSFALDDRSHYSDCIRLLVLDRPCSHSINAPLTAGILDARTSIISRSRVTDPFHFPSSYHPGRIFIILDASAASGTHHQVLRGSIIHTVHRVNDNTPSLTRGSVAMFALAKPHSYTSMHVQ